MSGSSIHKYTEAFLQNMIKLTNVAAGGEMPAAFDEDGTFIFSHNSYLDMALVADGNIPDIGGNGPQTLYLLQEEALAARDALNLYVGGSDNDRIVLDDNRRQTDRTRSKSTATIR